MNQFRVIAAVAITGLVGAMPAAAQGKSATRGAGATTHGRPTTTTTSTGTSTTTTSGATTHGKSADAGTRGKSADAGTRGSDKAGRKSPTASTSTTTAPTGANALSTRISSHPDQLAKINGMLPQGMTLEQATAGFRNQGQFIAALNASKNQGVPFADLQKAMTVDGQSLGQAVRQLKNAPPPATTGSTATPSGSGATGTGTTATTTSAS